uniref:Uncharacterized protein n=1 Tax=Arundo donax TaxID=35708 RepID=A0A0A9HGG5_ARUDO
MGRRGRAPGPCRRGGAGSCGSRGSPPAASSSPSDTIGSKGKEGPLPENTHL